MNKAVAIANLRSQPVGKFVEIVQEAESNEKDIGDLLDDLLKDIEMHYILNIFLRFSKKMLKGIACFYGLDWTDYFDRFVDYANLMRFTVGELNDNSIRN